MRTKHIGWMTAATAALVVMARADADLPNSRQDINPALLYWQAFSLYPQLAETDTRMLREPDAASGPGAAALAGRFDDAFRLIRRAAASRAACDWGTDLSDGPAAFVPSVPKLRTGAAAALLRARVNLDRGDELGTVENLKLALWMARHAAMDGTLVTVMVQTAIEDQIIDLVAGQFGRFSPRALETLETAFAHAPPHTPVARSVAIEKACFLDWFIAQILRCHAEHLDDEAAALAAVGRLWSEIFSDEGNNPSFEKVLARSGGTVDGLLAYARDVEPLYAELAALAEAGPADLRPGANRGIALIETSGNLIAERALPNVRRARIRELEVLTRLSLLRAALARQTGGEAAFRQLRDPYGEGPFQVRPVANGFELRSAMADAGFNASLILDERSSPR